MTLILGVKLPKGILLVSDTREVEENTDKVTSERKRKITMITPAVFLAGSSAESNFYTSKILRNCLYNAHSKYSAKEIRENILNLYQQVNELHKKSHKYGFPVGQILVAEYDKDLKEFNLLHQCGTVGFNNFNTFKNIKDIELIGSSSEVREHVKEQMSVFLNELTSDALKNPELDLIVALEFQRIIKQLNQSSIGKNIYYTYLTLLNGCPANCIYFVEENNKTNKISAKDDGEEINVMQHN